MARSSSQSPSRGVPRATRAAVGKRTNSAGESRRCHRRGTKMSSMALIPTGQHRRSSSALTENTCMLCSRHTIGARCSAGPFDNELVDPRRLTARVVVSASIGRFKQPQGWPRPCTGTDPVHEACKCRCHNMVYASDQSRKPRCMRTVHCSKNRRTHTAQHNMVAHRDASADRSNILDLFPEIMGSI